MEIRMHFRHMDSSLALYAYAERKIANVLEKLGLSASRAHLTFSADDTGHLAALQLFGRDLGVSLTCRDGSSLFAAVDALADKLAHRLARRKDRRLAARHDEAVPARAKLALAPAVPPLEMIDAGDIVAFERARREGQP